MKTAARTRGGGSEHLTQESCGTPENSRSAPSPQEYCNCRICIAASLTRALRQIGHGRHLIGADIISVSTFDLTRDAVWIVTGPDSKAPLCEHDRRHAIAKQIQDIGVPLVEGRE